MDAITGATDLTYLTTVDDVGSYLTAEVTATNAAGEVTVFSVRFGPIVTSSWLLVDATNDFLLIDAGNDKLFIE